jgi:hypothetical protein
LQGKFPRSFEPGQISLLLFIVAGPGLEEGVGGGGREGPEWFAVESPLTIAVTNSCTIGSSFETTLYRGSTQKRQQSQKAKY